ncbi:E3 ubiquitin-protein ligase TRIM39-like [Osmerus mordax]|uniref:E3 ubiquitin-protein ligase TRIM39-like n=1 Tax=Osmerus mordax TaxID=8014 RepID=UPI00350F2082
MASSSILLCEEQFQCSICLDVFIQPVSIPCGHNFCMACISDYWEGCEQCQCPLCNRTFDSEPDLSVNTFIAEMAAIVKQSAPAAVAASLPDQQHYAEPGGVACDVCTGRKLKAFKSCLVCLASYCETHLEPHQRVASFMKHKLIEPVANLEDRVCKTHERPLEFFCRTDREYVCHFCTEMNHKAHNAVLIEEECGLRKVWLGNTKSKVQKEISDRLQKIKEIESALGLSKRNAEKEVEESIEVFTSLVRYIERCQSALVEKVLKKQEAKEKWAEGLIKELELEIINLKKRRVELDQFSCNEDPFNLLQKFQSLGNSPPIKSWSDVKVYNQLPVGTLRKFMSQLVETLGEELKTLCGAELKAMQRYAVGVTLELDVANPKPVVFYDRKQMKRNTFDWLNDEHGFDSMSSVLGKEGYSSGRFYFEVQVERKSEWSVGVVSESINRKGNIKLNPVNGCWTVGLIKQNEYVANIGNCIHLALRQKPKKVGVYVDYEEGEVSFYDVKEKSLMYSFTSCTFTERIFPFLRS